MFNKKLQVEKVEMVKKIIRKYDYSDYERTHKECVELGLNVNRPALDRFGEKLQMLDSQAKSREEFTLEDAPVNESQEPVKLVSEPLTDTNTNGKHSQFASRADEITFELGVLKIREAELMEELKHIPRNRWHL